MNNYVYTLDGKAYVNITNRCHNACTFCIRNTGDGVAGVGLWLDREPTADETLAAFEEIRAREKICDEVVFCGYGEPTERLDVLVKVASGIKAAGYKLRLNTNGLGSKVAGRDIAPELTVFDVVSVSLNERDSTRYAQITRSEYGEKAFDAVIEFARSCRDNGINVVLTVVDVIGKDGVKACKALCDGLGIPLRVREYVSDNYASSKTDK